MRVLSTPTYGLLLSTLLAGSGCDVGGRISDYEDLPPQRITGYCASACTMKMLNGCVSPDTTLMFHGPSYYGFPLSDRDFQYWSLVIARHYPPKIAEWYLSEGRYTRTTMTGQEAIELGARKC